ncbi:unnamed protein product [Trifolium pratense]|uniref:Uncharacterized protein n=1 Tax=Trifolium pratense TaxID=57577 RepID=A0ACB0JVY2_TRIPR|nr:unnamed protein product [Trifolium pratense]
MFKTLKFLHAMILFFSIFLFAMNVGEPTGCKTHVDCPKDLDYRYVCFKKKCLKLKLRPFIGEYHKQEITVMPCREE